MTVSSAEIAQLVEHFTAMKGLRVQVPFSALVLKGLKHQYLQGFQAFLLLFCIRTFVWKILKKPQKYPKKPIKFSQKFSQTNA